MPQKLALVGVLQATTITLSPLLKKKKKVLTQHLLCLRDLVSSPPPRPPHVFDREGLVDFGDIMDVVCDE